MAQARFEHRKLFTSRQFSDAPRIPRIPIRLGEDVGRLVIAAVGDEKEASSERGHEGHGVLGRGTRCFLGLAPFSPPTGGTLGRRKSSVPHVVEGPLGA